jgi:hypothetical protein
MNPLLQKREVAPVKQWALPFMRSKLVPPWFLHLPLPFMPPPLQLDIYFNLKGRYVYGPVFALVASRS